MERKREQERVVSYSLVVVLALLGVIAFFLTDRRIAGMYFVALILLLVVDRRYRRYARSSTKTRSLPADPDGP
jgi:Flp pilus assembly protein TadB